MFGNIDPKKIQSMMKQMGIAQSNIEANRVIIEKNDGRIIIDNPSIMQINMQGTTNYQISGDIKIESIEEESDAEKLEADIAMIMKQTNSQRDVAALELEKCGGDIAETILNLNSQSKDKKK